MGGISIWGELPLQVELVSCVSETVRVYGRVEVVIILYLTLLNLCACSEHNGSGATV